MPSQSLVVRQPGGPGPRDEHPSHQASERPWDSSEFMEGYHGQVGPDGRSIIYGVDSQGGVPPRMAVVVPVPPHVPNVPGCSEAYGVYYQTGGGGGQKPECSSSRQKHRSEKPERQSKSKSGSSEKEKKKKKKEDRSGGGESAMAAIRFFSGETDVLGRKMGHGKRK